MLKNKTVLITGGSSGLGKALAIKLANQNANIALMSRNISQLEETALSFKNSPLLIQGDVSSESDCQKAIEQVVRHYGGLDHLVLNAGISMWSNFADLPDLSSIQQLIQTNYIGAVNCTYHALPHLKNANGMITVISSVQGKIGVPKHTGYAASKHALEGFFNSLRLELDNKIAILMVSPGWIAGTELKKRSLGKRPENIPAIVKKEAVSLETCCKEILSAILKRKRELIIPKKYVVLPWLKLIAPNFLDNLIRRKV